MVSEKELFSKNPSLDTEFYGSFFEKNPLPMWIFDLETYNFLAVNEAAVRRYGYSRGEFLSMTVADVRPREDLQKFADSISALKDSVFEHKGEWRHKLKTGEVIDVEILVSAVEFKGRKGALSLIYDVTERKKADAALRRSEAKYRELIESMPVGYYLSTTEGRFLEINPAFCRMVGYSREELLAMHIPSTLYFADSEREGETRYTGFSPVTEAYRLKGKGGSEVWVEDYARYIRDSSGKIIFHEGICRDITDRKRDREALQFSESRLRTVIENSSDTILFLDSEWRFIECLNAAAYEKLCGYSVAERLGKSAFDMFHPDELPTLKAKFPSTGSAGEVVRAEYRIKRKDGTWRWVEGAARNMLTDPSINALVIGVRDIEERKTAEKMLVESEERYRLLVQNSPDSIVVITDGKFAYLNPATLGPMHARTADDLLGKPILDFVHPDMRAKVVERIDRMMGTQKELPLEELKLIALDGSAFEVELRSAPVTYLGKPSIQSVIRDITSRRLVERQLNLQSVALNTAANGIVITDTSGTVVWANPAFESLTGFSLEEAFSKNMRDLIKSGKQDAEFYKQMWETILAGKVWRGELVNRRKDGTLYSEDMTIAPVREGQGKITHFVAVKQDVTDRKSLQEQLLQSQKLESIGQLAGGVAHDYNNILGVIIGYAELLKRQLTHDFEGHRSVDAILNAAGRGADLTRQLLAFARKEMISPKVVSLNTSIANIEKMLRSIIGENISLLFQPGHDLWNVKIDPSQFDQVLVNLAANSRDAIKGVGTITIKTMNISLERGRNRDHAALPPGDFVKVSFSDTGGGMKQETVRRIFEPFFTTKEKGHGTGLGLSTVYGIVKQNDGSIDVRSRPGEGTTFDIYLPRHNGTTDGNEYLQPDLTARGTETVLVVEDQADMLELTKESLEKYGYRVLTAIEPSEALLLCEAFGGTIHLLLTDVIMPGMSGRQLSETVRRARPEIKVVYMSGYTANELAPEGVLGDGVEFIQKPFTPTALAKKIGDVLNT